jgi:hypothetical protein
MGIQHPYPVLSIKWREVAKEFGLALDALEDVRAHGNRGAETLLKAWTSVLYRGAEYVEALERHVTRPLKAGFKMPRTLDRALSEQCNVLKHDAGRVGFFEAKAVYTKVVGYQIQHLRGDSLGPVEALHKRRSAYSFNLEMRRQLANLLVAGDLAAEAIRVAFNEPALPAHKGRFGLGERVLALPLFVFPSESKEAIPLLRKTDDGAILVKNSGGTAIPLLGVSLQLTATFTADGFTRQFALPMA